MCCADLYRAVIIQALKDAVAEVPNRLPEDPPPGFGWKITKNVPTTECAWRKRRLRNALDITEIEGARASARVWLTRWSHDFIDVCVAAGVNPTAVHERALALEAAGWPAEHIPECMAA